MQNVFRIHKINRKSSSQRYIRNKKKEVKEDRRKTPIKIRKEKRSVSQAGFSHWQHP